VAPGGRVERLQLNQQLVDNTRNTFARVLRYLPAPLVGTEHTVERRRAHTAARAGDRVDLFDEPDRATLFTSGGAQLLEEVADLAAGRAVILRLERGRRHEQERHARFARHRLGHVRLAGARRTFEQHTLTGIAAHHAAEGLVAKKEVERLHDLVFDRADPDDVVKADFDLARVVANVGRLAHRHHRDHEHDAENHDEAERQHDLQLRLRQLGHPDPEHVPGRDAPVHP
jgi:hypothetical protein